MFRSVGQDGREGWLYMLSNLGVLAVDGDPSDWRRENIKPLAKDPRFDMSEGSFDLSRLYYKRVGRFAYFGFDARIETPLPAHYCLAIDAFPDVGYTGIPGFTQDAAGNWVTFTSDHAPDYEMVFRRNSTGAIPYGNLHVWYHGGWYYWGNLEDVDFGATYTYDPKNHFFEFAIPIRYPIRSSRWHTILYSAMIYNSPAQDSTPSDPETYQEPHYGRRYANTLTELIEVPK